MPSARTVVEPVLQHAPPDAILLTAGDRSTFTLWYLQGVEEARPDLTVVDRHLLGFSWYRERLQAREPGLAGLADYDLPRFRRENHRPLCDIDLNEIAAEGFVSATQCAPATDEQ